MDNKFIDDVIFINRCYESELLNKNLTLGRIYTIEVNYCLNNYYLLEGDDDKRLLYPKDGFLSTKEAIKEVINKKI